MSIVWRNGCQSEGDRGVEPIVADWGAFTTAGCDHGRPLLWPLHRQRLAGSVAHLNGDTELELPNESDLVKLLVASGLGGPARLRVVASKKSSLKWCVEAVATACDAKGPSLAPGRLLIEQWNAAPPLVGHKTLARLPWDLARERAQSLGADDAIITDSEGRILETSIANIWVVKGGVARTPPASLRCLPGIMRGWLVDRLPKIGLEVSEEDIQIEELDGVDEVWLSNAVIGVQKVAEVSGVRWDTWPVFGQLADLGIPAPSWP